MDDNEAVIQPVDEYKSNKEDANQENEEAIKGAEDYFDESRKTASDKMNKSVSQDSLQQPHEDEREGQPEGKEFEDDMEDNVNYIEPEDPDEIENKDQKDMEEVMVSEEEAARMSAKYFEELRKNASDGMIKSISQESLRNEPANEIADTEEKNNEMIEDEGKVIGETELEGTEDNVGDMGEFKEPIEDHSEDLQAENDEIQQFENQEDQEIEGEEGQQLEDEERPIESEERQKESEESQQAEGEIEILEAESKVLIDQAEVDQDEDVGEKSKEQVQSAEEQQDEDVSIEDRKGLRDDIEQVEDENVIRNEAQPSVEEKQLENIKVESTAPVTKKKGLVQMLKEKLETVDSKIAEEPKDKK